MAIFHLSTKPVRRSTGRSAVAAAAYRSGTRLVNEREGVVYDFRARAGIVRTEIVLPSGIAANWAYDREALWNAAETAEVRRDARVAREWEIALPHELTPEQRLMLTRDFAQAIADHFGVAVDFAIHEPQSPSDSRNHHAHVLTTTREIRAGGLGTKVPIEWDGKRLAKAKMPRSREQIRHIRVLWEEIANEHLARAGIDARIDHRSHHARGLHLDPTRHVGVHATSIIRAGGRIARTRLEVEAEERNLRLLSGSPEDALSVITAEKSVFRESDVGRTVRRYLGQTEHAHSVVAAIMKSPQLVPLTPKDVPGGLCVGEPRFTTRALLKLEQEMVACSMRLASRRTHRVSRRHLNRLIARSPLSIEQREAVRHATGERQAAAIIGLAGAGKTTMLAVARRIWEEGGYRVFGAALAGKAAENLSSSSGIQSRTLASWERRWELGVEGLGPGDIMVIDEAGMVGSAQMKRLLDASERVGFKLVLVGDPAQLQPIAAGAAFRAIAERVGFAELTEIRRQTEEWQRKAARDLARFRTSEALASYRAHGGIELVETRDRALAEAVAAYLKDERSAPTKSRMLMAYRRADVAAVNEEIRSIRQSLGQLSREVEFDTYDGTRHFAVGDRILFRETRDGYKNGWLGTVVKAQRNDLSVRLDTSGTLVPVNADHYDAVDYGYATTIHKAQGATVDRAFVVASKLMNRHLTYVALTRHREAVKLFAGLDEFQDIQDLSRSLSRAETKETTLDYAARRGLEQDRRIGARDDLRRASHLFESVTHFEHSEEQAARESLRMQPGPRKLLVELRSAIEKVYRDPERALQRLLHDLEERAPRDRLETRIAGQPEVLGDLKGRQGILAFGASRATRREALEALPSLVAEARLYRRAFQNLLPDAIAHERARREAMRIPVPHLSDHARSLLEGACARQIGSEAWSRAADDARVKEEIQAFARALERRFGDIQKMTQEQLKSRVRSSELDKLQGSRPLLIAAQHLARRTSRGVEQMRLHSRTLAPQLGL